MDCHIHAVANGTTESELAKQVGGTHMLDPTQMLHTQ